MAASKSNRACAFPWARPHHSHPKGNAGNPRTETHSFSAFKVFDPTSRDAVRSGNRAVRNRLRYRTNPGIPSTGGFRQGAPDRWIKPITSNAAHPRWRP